MEGRRERGRKEEGKKGEYTHRRNWTIYSTHGLTIKERRERGREREGRGKGEGREKEGRREGEGREEILTPAKTYALSIAKK